MDMLDVKLTRVVKIVEKLKKQDKDLTILNGLKATNQFDVDNLCKIFKLSEEEAKIFIMFDKLVGGISK